MSKKIKITGFPRAGSYGLIVTEKSLNEWKHSYISTLRGEIEKIDIEDYKQEVLALLDKDIKEATK
jgi:hypothetical protein